MANTLELSGNLYKKRDTTTETTKSISVSKTFTEYTEQQILVAAAGAESINFGGIAYPKFLYIISDEAVTVKAFSGGDVIASALPVNPDCLITSGTQYGTVTISNPGATQADVKIYAGG